MRKIERPRILHGETHRIRAQTGNLYVIVNSHENKVFEVILSTQKSGFDGNATAESLGRMISLNLRSGVSLQDIIDQLKNIQDSEIPGEDELSITESVVEILETYLTN